MFEIDGKTEINPLQVVVATEDKGGATWTIQLTDDKQFQISRSQYFELRKLVNRKVSIVCQTESP